MSLAAYVTMCIHGRSPWDRKPILFGICNLLFQADLLSKDFIQGRQRAKSFQKDKHDGLLEAQV